MPTELFVTRRGRQTWTAVREDGRTIELRAESTDDEPTVGRVVRARVTRVLPGIQSAFLDLGGERDGFLHVRDLWLPGEERQPPFRTEVAGAEIDDEDGPPPAEGPSWETGRLSVPAPIEDRLKVGRELVVQVSRGSFGAKGGRVTCYLTLPGRLLVLFPHTRMCSVSRRIKDEHERERLREILVGIGDEDAGFVARTAAEGADAGELLRDAASLVETYRTLSRAVGSGGPLGVLHGDVELALRLLRDAPRDGYSRVVFDDRAMLDRAAAYARRAAPELLSALEHHAGPRALFEAQGLDAEVEKALRPKVWLKSGGTIVIERTEALVSIDVNTGKFLGKRQLEETALQTNLEAAAEIARQLRLRDLGGIIVVDFIDMAREANRQSVVEALSLALQADRARTHIQPLSSLGLLQLTRKRTREAPENLWTDSCSACRGQGRVKRPETVAALAAGELLRLAEETPQASFLLSAPRAVLETARESLPDRIQVRCREAPELAPDRYEIRLIPGPA